MPPDIFAICLDFPNDLSTNEMKVQKCFPCATENQSALVSKRHKYEDHFHIWAWHNAIVNLFGILEEFALEDYDKALLAGVTGYTKAEEMLMIFEDFYEMVGPESMGRARELSKELDAQLFWFNAFATAAINTRQPVKLEQFLRLYDRLRYGFPVAPDAPPAPLPELAPDAVLPRRQAWQQLQRAAAMILEALRPLM